MGRQSAAAAVWRLKTGRDHGHRSRLRHAPPAPQRKKTLLVEYKSLRKANSFVDRRFGGGPGAYAWRTVVGELAPPADRPARALGAHPLPSLQPCAEQNPELSVEDRALARFQAERMRRMALKKAMAPGGSPRALAAPLSVQARVGSHSRRPLTGWPALASPPRPRLFARVAYPSPPTPASPRPPPSSTLHPASLQGQGLQVLAVGRRRRRGRRGRGGRRGGRGRADAHGPVARRRGRVRGGPRAHALGGGGRLRGSWTVG
jgi:hypothetical protein